MKGDRITVATVPDAATAELLREVLSDGGITDVELKSSTGVAYMPRTSALEYEVRVDEDDAVRARRVLADFEEQSGQAATSQAGDTIAPSEEERVAAPPRRRWVFWVALTAAIVLFAPILFSALGIVQHLLVMLTSP